MQLHNIACMLVIHLFVEGLCFKCVVSLGKMKSHLLSIFAISIVSHLVSIFEIKICLQVSKQTNNQPTNQPTKQTPYREDKSLCSAAGATKKAKTGGLQWDSKPGILKFCSHTPLPTEYRLSQNFQVQFMNYFYIVSFNHR